METIKKEAIERVNSLHLYLENFKEMVKSGLVDEKALLKEYPGLSSHICYLSSENAHSLGIKYVFRSRFINNDDNIELAQTFSYIANDRLTEKFPSRKRMNLTGQAMFYSSVCPNTNFREIRLDVKKEDVVYIGKWDIEKPLDINLYPLISESIEKLKPLANCKELYEYFSFFHELMLERFNDNDELRYLPTALFANVILNSNDLYDGIVYPSVQCEDKNRRNVVFTPMAVDKYLKLKYVIKGIVREDLHSIDFCEIGFNYNGKIKWYRLEQTLGTTEIVDCYYITNEGLKIKTDTGTIFDAQGNIVKNHKMIIAKDAKNWFPRILSNEQFQKNYNFLEIIDEKSMEKDINIVSARELNGWCMKKDDSIIKIMLFCMELKINTKLVPVETKDVLSKKKLGDHTFKCIEMY